MTMTPDINASNRELGFIRGLQIAARLARARGDFAVAVDIAMLACSPEQTFILANTDPEPVDADALRN